MNSLLRDLCVRNDVYFIDSITSEYLCKDGINLQDIGMNVSKNINTLFARSDKNPVT